MVEALQVTQNQKSLRRLCAHIRHGVHTLGTHEPRIRPVYGGSGRIRGSCSYTGARICLYCNTGARILEYGGSYLKIRNGGSYSRIRGLVSQV